MLQNRLTTRSAATGSNRPSGPAPSLQRSRHAGLHALDVAIDANAAAYRRAVQTSAPGDCWDFVVLTAANDRQAQRYRQELALRHRAVGPAGAFFPAIQRSLVVADPPGRRAGSGGATLAVLRALVDQYAPQFGSLDRLRILLIHSGGASQRLPAYSSMGKIFSPLPLLRPDGQIATLFDHLYVTLAGLPQRLGPGLLVLAGDVFLLFDHRQVAAPSPGVTAISMPVDAGLGRGHGVFVTDANRAITAALQKVSPDAMRRAGATDEHGRVQIDTGLLFFDAAQTRHLAAVAGCPMPDQPDLLQPPSPRADLRGLHERHAVPIDLYTHITAALSSGTSRSDFVRPGPLHDELWRAFHDIPFHLMRVDGQFLHLGTTQQFRDAMTGANSSPAAELFQRNVLVHSQWPLPDGRRVYHSALLADDSGAGGQIGPGAVVEHSVLSGRCRIGRGSVVSQVICPQHPIELGADLLLFQVPVRPAADANVADASRLSPADEALLFVHVLCGVEDDFKTLHGQGGCLFLNRPIDEFLTRHALRPDDIWPDVPPERRTLWTARLFPATTARECIDTVLTLAGADPGSLAAWSAVPRFSMAMVLESADPTAMIAQREIVAARLQSAELLARINAHDDRPAAADLAHFATADAYDTVQSVLQRFADAPASTPRQALQQARALWSAAELLARPDHPGLHAARDRVEPLMVRAFASIAQATEIGHRTPPRSRDRSPLAPPRARPRCPRITPGIRITATSPVRIDLAGGWSDTPPYCFERGGLVVNVAIDLDGRPPICATVRTLHEPKLVLESHDLAQRTELTEWPDDAVDVHDPFALHKIALQMAGLTPERPPGHLRPEAHSVRTYLERLGAGLHVATECRVPKGSGLGTSSILAATLLGALHGLLGRVPPPRRLFEQTLLLEQRLSTGGGWQDQVGGIIGGIKSTSTPPGVPQRLAIQRLDLSDRQFAALNDRLVVYYTGQQRLARDIVRRVMGRWLAREPAMLALMRQLRQSAALLRDALVRGRWTAVGRQIDRYWQIKKELYPGTTTPAVDVLFLEQRELYLAAGLAGAGGGGFAYFFCKDRRQANRLRDALRQYAARPGNLGSLFASRINPVGLTVHRQNGPEPD